MRGRRTSRQTKTQNVNSTNTEEVSKNEETVATIINIEGDNRPHVMVEILGAQLQGLLDSGASCTILGQSGPELLEELKISIQPADIVIKTADGTNHKILGKADIPFCCQNKFRVVTTLIVPTIPKNLILGIDFWDAFNIVPQMCDSIELSTGDETSEQLNEIVNLSTTQQSALDKVVQKFLVSDGNKIGLTNLLSHTIDTGNSKPVVKRPYPLSPYLQKEVDAELNRMLTLDVIEEAQSDWSNPIVVVRKPTGKIRLCLDARGLNQVTVKDAYPLPHINRILGQIRGTKFLSSVDLSDAFWQVPLHIDSRPKTAFIVPGRGHFMFKRLPFGLCNAAQTLVRLIDRVMGVDLEPQVFVYLDDIIIATDTFEQHVSLLAEVAKRLRKANLTISLTKSKFCTPQLNYLGYLLDERGLTMDPEKITPILNFPAPRNVREVRRLMGMAGWYRRFIGNFAILTAPITDLLKKSGTKFKWTEQANDAFLQLKTLLVSAPILASPDFDKPFAIQTDASDTGIGAILTQGEGKEEKVVAYMSQKLSSTQRKYGASERECLAVIEAIYKFRPYIEGVHFKVITDCSSLIWLMSLRDPTSRLARWALKLQGFDFELLHRKGKLNVVADALSRSVEIIEILKQGKTEDVEYNELAKKIFENPTLYPQYKIENGQIFKHCVLKNNDLMFEPEWIKYVPKENRKAVLREFHDQPLGAHLGIMKTYKKISGLYYWPKLHIDVKTYVRNCRHCQANKPSNQISKVPMGEQRKPTKPWQMIGVDFLGPYPRSKEGNQHLIIVHDLFSKFCVLKAVRRAESKSLIKIIEEQVFLVFGVPAVLISDNGTQFISKDFEQFLSAYGVEHWLNPVYHPQSNPSERVNQGILASIRAYIKDDQRVWDEQIPKIACAIRTAVHESSKFTPFFINFGREMVLYGKDVRSPGTTTEKKHEEMEKVFKIVQTNLKNAYNRYSKTYNLRSTAKTFEEGEKVLRKNFKLSNAVERYNAKLGQQFVEAEVYQKIGSCTYILKDPGGRIIGRYHANDLRKLRAS